MDAMAVLESVAGAYTKLKTFSVEILTVVEAGDEDSFSRKGHRAGHGSKRPTESESSNLALKGLSRSMMAANTTGFNKGANWYSKSSTLPGGPAPGSFLPNHAVLNVGLSSFLFSRIAENVASAQNHGPRADVSRYLCRLRVLASSFCSRS
jgi:hypothetical protein